MMSSMWNKHVDNDHTFSVFTVVGITNELSFRSSIIWAWQISRGCWWRGSLCLVLIHSDLAWQCLLVVLAELTSLK